MVMNGIDTYKKLLIYVFATYFVRYLTICSLSAARMDYFVGTSRRKLTQFGVLESNIAHYPCLFVASIDSMCYWVSASQHLG